METANSGIVFFISCMVGERVRWVRLCQSCESTPTTFNSLLINITRISISNLGNINFMDEMGPDLRSSVMTLWVEFCKTNLPAAST